MRKGGAAHRRVAAVVLGVLLALPLPSGGATTRHDSEPPPERASTGPDYNSGRELPVLSGHSRLPAREYAGRSQLGERRIWFALDDYRGHVYTKSFRLHAVGRRAEIWVAQNLSFPPGDCRNDERIKVTDAQIEQLMSEFDTNIYPKESRTFSRPPSRDGSDGKAPEYIDVGRRYYKGPARKIVLLVDNVRDANYYDSNNADNRPYIIGFFFSFFNDLTDRNVMTIDAYDWLHRTGEDPPHEPNETDLCNSMPARPRLIEETMAHEYQHLLHHYEDGNETNWLNEGLSDWAQTLVGYANPHLTVADRGFDRHIECFLGFCDQRTDYNPNPAEMGPENSLTLWEEEGDKEILSDYGAAYTFMELLHGRYGEAFMQELHRNNYNGLRSLRRILKNNGIPARPRDIVKDWAAALALDQVLDDGAVLHGGEGLSLQVPTLQGRINWSTPHSHDSPGVPPNGSDFVRLGDEAGRFLDAAEVDSISFSSSQLPQGSSISLQLIAYDDAHSSAWIARPPLDEQGGITLSGAELDALIGTSADTVAAIVTMFDPSESHRDYVPYTLTVNGVQQPGG